MSKKKPVRKFSDRAIRLGRNRHRINRMEEWLQFANETSEENCQARFVFLWIAYEAAWQKQNFKNENSGTSWKFLTSITEKNKDELQLILYRHRKTIKKLFELRWASNKFWFEQEHITTLRQWETSFAAHVERLIETLEKAIDDGTPKSIRKALDNLFRVLRLCRNQILHGASSGRKSLGKKQVKWGAELLGELVPCFIEIIEGNLDEDWDIPPFEHVAVGIDPKKDYPPPWLNRK